MEGAAVTAIQKLRDPFDYHVYIGHSLQNGSVIGSLRDALKRRLGLLGGLRCDIHSLSEESLNTWIEFSEKCLVYLSPEYSNDVWRTTELTAVVVKARCFSRGLVCVMIDPRLSLAGARQMLPCLDEFSTVSWPCHDELLPPALIDWLLAEVALDPIPRMPEKITGYGEALVYYMDYLRFVLRDHRANVRAAADKWPPKTMRRGVSQLVEPMIIVVPESCKSPPSFDLPTKEGTTLETLDKLYIHCPGDRGGNKNRDYKRSVMKLTVAAAYSEQEEEFLFSGEFPGCLLTMYETRASRLSGMTSAQLDAARDEFVATLQSLLCHPDSSQCVDQYRLVIWRDRDEDVDLGSTLLPALRDVVLDGDASSLVIDTGRKPHQENASFRRVQRTSVGEGPGSKFENVLPYVMRSDVARRGICLIVHVDSVSTGAQRYRDDVDELRRLFADRLNFDVRVHGGRLASQLHEFVDSIRREDHSQYDAFVCCILCCGQPGCICTVDDGGGTKTPVVELAMSFGDANCPSLVGKPKLFLVQTTVELGGSGDSSTSSDGTETDAETTQVKTLSLESAVATSSSSSSTAELRREKFSRQRDAVGFSGSIDDELLIPSSPDFIMSYAWLPATEESDTESVSPYVGALLEHLNRGEDVEKALQNVSKGVQAKLANFPSLKKAVSCPSAVGKTLVFPS